MSEHFSGDRQFPFATRCGPAGCPVAGDGVTVLLPEPSGALDSPG